MPSKKSQFDINMYSPIIFSVIAFALGGLFGCYLCQSVRQLPKESAPIDEMPETKTETYENKEYGFSFQYPVDSEIEQANQDYIVKVQPPAKFSLDETELIIKTIKEPFGESIDRLMKQDLQNSTKNVFTGILTDEIDGLPIKRFYTITCPEIGSNCEKTNKYYVSAKGNTYIITTTIFTDTANKPINEQVTEEMISSIRF